MCEDNGHGYKSMCANEETVEEKGLLRRRKLTYELEREGPGAVGLGWAGSSLGWPDQAWFGSPQPGLATSAWLARDLWGRPVRSAGPRGSGARLVDLLLSSPEEVLAG